MTRTMTHQVQRKKINNMADNESNEVVENIVSVTVTGDGQDSDVKKI